MGVNTLEVNADHPDPYQTGYVENAILAEKNGKYGFYDYEGNVLTECKFTSVSQNLWTFYAYIEDEEAYVMDSDFTSYSPIEDGIGGAYPEITIQDHCVISNGEPVKTPIYDYLPEDELFVVDSDRGTGIIDQNGNIVCEIDGWYSSVASTFANGYIFLSDTEWTYDYETDQDTHGELMLFNTNGEQILKTTVDDAGYMRDGYAPVKKNDHW